MSPKKKPKYKLYEDSFYCDQCGGCGYIGCCGIRSFLNAHVIGKTDCKNESTFVAEIIEIVEENETFKLNFPEGDGTQMKEQKNRRKLKSKNLKPKKKK